jgi:hypothetical protein
MKPTLISALAAVLALDLSAPRVSSPTAPAAKGGPFLVELPVSGLTPAHEETVATFFENRFGRNVLELTCREGVLSFYFGGQGPKALLRLSDAEAVLKKADLAVDPQAWVLEPQEVGLYVRAAEGIGDKGLKDALATVPGRPEVLGFLIDGERACVVVDLAVDVAFTEFENALQKSGVAIKDLAWGHWHHGFGISRPGEDSHRHVVRAKRR